jgi:hypothetical protein
MIKHLFRRARASFAEPTFTHRRSFSGAHYYRCDQTAADYGMIPVGYGSYLVSRDGELLGKAATHAQAAATIRSDARTALRSHRSLAA